MCWSLCCWAVFKKKKRVRIWNNCCNNVYRTKHIFLLLDLPPARSILHLQACVDWSGAQTGVDLGYWTAQSKEDGFTSCRWRQTLFPEEAYSHTCCVLMIWLVKSTVLICANDHIQDVCEQHKEASLLCFSRLISASCSCEGSCLPSAQLWLRAEKDLKGGVIPGKLGLMLHSNWNDYIKLRAAHFQSWAYVCVRDGAVFKPWLAMRNGMKDL